jgi:nitrogen-specific signal transduction histidine kinase
MAKPSRPEKPLIDQLYDRQDRLRLLRDRLTRAGKRREADDASAQLFAMIDQITAINRKAYDEKRGLK